MSSIIDDLVDLSTDLLLIKNTIQNCLLIGFYIKPLNHHRFVNQISKDLTPMNIQTLPITHDTIWMCKTLYYNNVT